MSRVIARGKRIELPPELIRGLVEDIGAELERYLDERLKPIISEIEYLKKRVDDLSKFSIDTITASITSVVSAMTMKRESELKETIKVDEFLKAIDKLTEQFGDLIRRFSRIEASLSTLKIDTSPIDTSLSEVKSKSDRIEKSMVEMNERLKGLDEKISSLIDILTKLISTVERTQSSESALRDALRSMSREL
ncbi:MAG: hypothetical protein DRP01_00745 [Archaeoglobales archaeon]|nr:MAG: hypothetical protein DRP01_00745 [Archaeoglobales archaeon]